MAFRSHDSVVRGEIDNRVKGVVRGRIWVVGRKKPVVLELKRALTDPQLFSGIGNAYSDEILHRARLSPVALTQKLSPEAMDQLFHATQQTLTHWIEILRQETGDNFLEHVTAFRPEMAVHGKFGKPCPVCSVKVQRIRYASNETNYCPGCQTGGKLLADRSLSLLLRKDWPKTPEELEELRSTRSEIT